MIRAKLNILLQSFRCIDNDRRIGIKIKSGLICLGMLLLFWLLVGSSGGHSLDTDSRVKFPKKIPPLRGGFFEVGNTEDDWHKGQLIPASLSHRQREYIGSVLRWVNNVQESPHNLLVPHTWLIEISSHGRDFVPGEYLLHGIVTDGPYKNETNLFRVNKTTGQIKFFLSNSNSSSDIRDLLVPDDEIDTDTSRFRLTAPNDEFDTDTSRFFFMSDKPGSRQPVQRSQCVYVKGSTTLREGFGATFLWAIAGVAEAALR
jgi:hypothetical protein